MKMDPSLDRVVYLTFTWPCPARTRDVWLSILQLLYDCANVLLTDRDMKLKTWLEIRAQPPLSPTLQIRFDLSALEKRSWLTKEASSVDVTECQDPGNTRKEAV